jgi:hypothetical protein
VGDQPVARPLPAHRTVQRQNKRTQTSIPQVELKPTNRVIERAKTVHAFDRAATVIGRDLSGNISLVRTKCIPPSSLSTDTDTLERLYITQICIILCTECTHYEVNTYRSCDRLTLFITTGHLRNTCKQLI